MASNYGFVYVLRNECMPGIYKIGMTDRAPSTRCNEISCATAAPLPFEIVCFAEVMNPREVERDLHQAFGAKRLSPDREFFALTGDDFAPLFARLVEEGHFCHGDISFLSKGESGCRPIIRIARERVSASSLDVVKRALDGGGC